MAITYANVGVPSTAGATSISTGNIVVAASRCVVVCVCTKQNSIAGSTVTDDAGNVYNLVIEESLNNAGSNGRGLLYISGNISALSAQKITFTQTSSTAITMSVLSIGGVKQVANPSVKWASGFGSSSSPSVASGAPGVANCAFVGMVASDVDTGTFTQAGSWATPPNEAKNAAGVRVNGGHFTASDSASHTYAPSYSSTRNWAALIVAIQPAPPVTETGTATLTFAGLSFSASGSAAAATVTGTAILAFSGLSFSASGAVRHVKGTGTLAFDGIAINAVGTGAVVPNTGKLAFSGLAFAAAGTTKHTGTATLAFSGLSIAAQATPSHIGTATLAFSKLSFTATGVTGVPTPTIVASDLGTACTTSGSTVSKVVAAAHHQTVVVCVTEISNSGLAVNADPVPIPGAVTDSKGNVYVLRATRFMHDDIQKGFGAMFCAHDVTALSGTDVITYTKAVSGARTCMSILAVSGLLSGDPFDSAATNAGSTNPPGQDEVAAQPNVTSAVPVEPQSFFVAMVASPGSSGTFTQAVGWTTPPANAQSGTTGASSRVSGGHLTDIGQSAQLYAPTFSSNNFEWAAFILVLQPSNFNKIRLHFAGLRMSAIGVAPIAASTSRRRAWTFNFDGHTFYVLGLGSSGTFLYDAVTDHWCKFETFGYAAWNMVAGGMWGDRVVAGDVLDGRVWEMVPSALIDQGSLVIEHAVTGGLQTRSRVFRSLESLRITASVGQLAGDAVDFKLRFSDDNGKTWSQVFIVTLAQGDFSGEIAYRSLGAFMAPGRIFELTDSGGLVRIDGCDAFIDNFDTDPLPQGGQGQTQA